MNLRNPPRPPPTAVAVELEVPFHDVDMLGIVWHGHYAKYLELARTALLRARGVDELELRAWGYRFLVAESHLRHLRPLRYGERARVEAWFTAVLNKLHVAYRVVSAGTGQACVHAETVLVTVDERGALCLETPAPVLARLRAPGPGSAADVEEPCLS